MMEFIGMDGKLECECETTELSRKSRLTQINNVAEQFVSQQNNEMAHN